VDIGIFVSILIENVSSAIAGGIITYDDFERESSLLHHKAIDSLSDEFRVVVGGAANCN